MNWQILTALIIGLAIGHIMATADMKQRAVWNNVATNDGDFRWKTCK